MKVVKFSSLENLIGIQNDWNRLVDSHNDLTVFQRFEWVASWWQVFGDENELFVLAVYDDSRLVGVAPLFCKTLDLLVTKARQLQFLAEEVSDYCRLITAAGYEERVIRALLDYLQEHKEAWHFLRFKEMPEKAFCLFAAPISSRNLSWSQSVSSRTFIVNLENRTWESYLQTISKRLKKLYRRHERLLIDTTIKIVSGPDITPEIMEEIITLNHLALSDKRKTLMFVDEQYRKFHCDYLLNSPFRHLVQIVMLYFNKKLVSYNYNFIYKKVYSEYNCCHDKIFSKLSLGLFLDFYNLKHAFASGYKCIDFLRGDFLFKRRYGAEMQLNHELIIFKNIAVKWIYFFLRKGHEFLNRNYLRWFVPLKRIRLLIFELTGYYAHAVRKKGWRHYAGPGLKMLLKKIYIHADSYILSVRPQNILYPRATRRFQKDVIVREITLVDYALLEQYVARKNMQMLIGRFWGGDRCWGALHKGKLVGYSWITQRDQFDQDHEAKIKVGRNDIYLYDGIIDKPYRGKGLMVLLLKSTFEDAKVKKAQRLFCLVDTNNNASQKIMKRFNFEIEARIKRRKLFFINRQIRESFAAPSRGEANPVLPGAGNKPGKGTPAKPKVKP